MPVFTLTAAAYAAFGAVIIGFIPVFAWLAFWLIEDWRHPEPQATIATAFVIGMFTVPVVLFLEWFASAVIPRGYGLIFVWAFIEEAVKLIAAYLTVFKSWAVDEPLDYPIYLITVAIGFAAVENALFLFSPLLAGNGWEGAVTGNLRFIGPTLVHILGASVIGGALAFAFFREPSAKLWYGVVGVILATALHSLFNILIIITGAGNTLTVFLGLWVGIIFALLALEKIKLLRAPAWWERIKTL